MPNILKFVFRFLAIYIFISLLHLVPLVKTINIAVYTTFQQAVFNVFHPTVRTDFDPYSGLNSSDKTYDFTVEVYNKAKWKAGQARKPNAKVNQRARLISIVPFAFLFALVFASPSSLKRKLIGFTIASIFLLVYLALKYTYLIDSNAPMLSPKSWSFWMTLSKLFIPCYRTHEAMFLLIVPIWIVSTLSIKDLKWMIQ